MMYKVDDLPELDEYGSRIFEHPIQKSWRLFRYITKMAVPGSWVWNSDLESVSYPSQAEVPTFEEFMTLMLHESAHGWCHFNKTDPSSKNYPGLDEEQVCWDVSRLICGRLGINYQEDLASLNHQFHICRQAGDIEGLDRIMKKLPAHNQL